MRQMIANARTERHSQQATARLGLIAGLLAAAAAQAESLTYVLQPEFGRGVLRVELTWETGERRTSILGVSPRWGPIDNVPGMLRDVRFVGATWRREGSQWILSHRPRQTIRVRYQVDAGARDFSAWERTHHPIAARDFFHGMGNTFLLVPMPAPGTPETFEVVLRWRLPAGFDAICSWGRGRTVGDRLRAMDLRHSVYLAGRLEVRDAQQDDRRVTVALVDRFDFDADDLLKMATRIIRHQCDFMVEREFPDFVVTAIPVGPPIRPGESRIAGAGLYHSFALFLAPRSRLTDGVQHLFAHELFHTWNGRLLPAAQPERRVAWFTEGVTDYYALRILFESGDWDARIYARWINRHLRQYVQNPARNATNAEIERDYWTQRDTVGEVAYQRGLLLGLRWHALARRRGVPEGFDRLFRTLIERGRQGGFQLTNDAVRRTGVQVLGDWFGPEFDRYVIQAATVDVPPDALEPQLVGELTDVYAFDLGFDRETSLRERRIRGLKPGSAAARAGLREGDVLVGWRVHDNPDEKIELAVRRGDKTAHITYLPRGRRYRVVQFSPRASRVAGPRRP